MNGNLITITTVIGCFLGVSGFVYKLVTDVRNESTKRIGRVYERFDDFKDHLEGTHVRKEMCSVMHKQICEDMSEVRNDVKELLKRIKFNGGSE